MAYNLVRVPTPSRRAISYNWRNSDTSGHEVWIYRNTLVGTLRGLAGTGYTVTMENNVLLPDDDPPIQTSNDGRTVVDINNLTGASNAPILGGQYNLTGQHRQQYFGTHGWELAPVRGGFQPPRRESFTPPRR